MTDSAPEAPRVPGSDTEIIKLPNEPALVEHRVLVIFRAPEAAPYHVLLGTVMAAAQTSLPECGRFEAHGVDPVKEAAREKALLDERNEYRDAWLVASEKERDAVAELKAWRADHDNLAKDASRANQAENRLTETLAAIEVIKASLEATKVSFEATKADRNEIVNRWKRVLADFENYQKRVKRDQEKAQQETGRKMIMDLLPVVDNVDLLLDNSLITLVCPVLSVRALRSELLGLLAKNGAVQVEVNVSDLFSPNLHEAVKVEDGVSSQSADEIASVIRKGYKLGSVMLRPALVSVKKAAPVVQQALEPPAPPSLPVAQ